MRRRSLLSETNKRAGYITTHSTANTLTYTGNSQLLITSAAGSGTILYSLDNINFSSSIPTAINAGSYTVYYKAAESRFFLESTVYNVSCNISRASGYILTEPTPKSLTYTGSAQTLLNEGNGTGTIYYSLTSNANFSTTIPTSTNAGTYTVYYYAAESINYTQSSTGSILVSIKKANLSASVSMAGWTYGSTASNPSVSGNSGSGSVTYTYKVSTAADSTYTTTKPSNAGTYTVRAQIAETSNYFGATVTNSFTISQKTVSLSWGTTSWTYDGSAHSTTCTAGGLVSGDTCTVTLTGNSITNKGTTTVTASSLSNSNYALPSAKTATLTINIRTVTVTAPTKTDRTYTGSAQTIFAAGSCTTGGTIYYSSSNSTFSTSTWSTSIPYTQKTDAGTYTIYWYCYVSDTTNNTGTNINTKNSISATINKKSRSGAVSCNNVTYGSTVTASVSGNTENGTITWGITAGTGTATISGGVVTPTKVGTVTVTASVAATANYAAYTATSKQITISQRTVTWSAPTRTNTVYNGANQIIFAVGSCTAGGQMQYSSNNSTWSTSIPYTLQKEPGTYTIYYKCVVSDTTNNTGTNINTSYSLSAAIYKISTNSPVLAAGTKATYDGNYVYATAKNGSGNPAGIIYYGNSSNSTSYSITASSTATNLSSMGRRDVGTTTIYAFFRATDSSHYYDSSSVSTTASVTNRATGSSGSVSNPAAQTYKTSGTYSYQLGISGATGTVTYPTSITVKNSANTAISGWSCTAAGVVTVPARTTAGNYTVTGNITVATSTNYNSVGATSKTWTITISKANQSAPTATGATVTYHNTATATASGGGGQGTLTWTNGNTRTAVGSLSTLAYWAGNSNYNASPKSSAVNLVVNKATDQSVSVTLINRNYISGSAQTIATATSHGCTYYLGFGTSSAVLSWGSAGAALAASNAGTYYIWYKGTADGNHSADVATTYKGAVTINKINPTITNPTAKTGLSYTGSAQTLVNAGSNTTSGTFKYSLSGGSYSTTLPSATNANTGGYLINWMFTPNDTTNYNSASGSFYVAIAKVNPSYTAPTAYTLTYNGSAQYLTSAGSTSHGTILFSSNNSSWSTTRCTATNANTSGYTTYWRLVGDANHNDVSSKSLTSYIGRAASAISFSGNGTVEKGKTMTKAATRTKGDGAITYSSSNTAIATVNSTGTVTGVSVGSCTITVTTGQTTNYLQATATYTLTVTHLTVDLGLPSGTLWASYNLGASNPGEVGLYYSWGTLTGYSASSGHNWGTGNDTSPYSSVAARNQTTALTDAQDAARLNWGTSWKMPTEEDRLELFLNCTRTKATYNGVTCWKFTSNKNGNVLYFPAGGWLKSTSVLQNSAQGRYWMRDVGGTPKDQGKQIWFNTSTNLDGNANGAKYLACPIRAINIDHVAY